MKRTGSVLPYVCFFLLFLSCSQEPEELHLYGEDKSRDNLEQSTLTIYTPVKIHKRQSQVTRELEARLKNELNIQIQFQFERDYYRAVENAIRRGRPIDGFLLSPRGWFGHYQMFQQGLAMDISTLFPQYAPEYFNALPEELLGSVSYQGKLMGVPPYYYYSNRLYALIRSDYQQRYDIPALTTWEKVEEAAEVLEQMEDDVIPLSFYDNMASLFAPGYGYALIDNSNNLVYRKDNGKIQRWEETPEFSDSLDRYRKWYKNGYIQEGTFQYTENSSIIRSGRYPLWIGRLNDMLKFNRYAFEQGLSWRYNAYPLPNELIETRIPLSGYGIALSPTSEHPERVLQLMEWIHRNQENYDLYHYGIVGEDFSLQGEYITVPENHILEDAFFNRERFSTMDIRYERLSLANSHISQEELRQELDKESYPLHWGYILPLQWDFSRRNNGGYSLEKSIVNGGLTDETFQKYLSERRESGIDAELYRVQEEFEEYIKDRQ